MDLAARAALADALMNDDETPKAVTAAHFALHPEWDLRYGAAGRRRFAEDVRLHLSFLAGAVQAGAPQLFADYARWCAERHASHGIDRAHLTADFDLLEASLALEPEARDLVHRVIDAARGELAANPPSVVRTVGDAAYCLAYVTAALGGRRDAAWEVTREALRGGYSLARVYRDVVIAAQKRLGELWAEAKITVAQEHMASSVTQSLIARLYAEIPGERSAGRMLMLGVEGELHSLPAQLASDLLELDGWDVAFVGTNVPLQSALACVESERPNVVGISATMPCSLARTVAMVRAIRAKFSTLRIVVGGRAFRDAGALVHELGVEVASSDGSFA